MNRRLLVFNDHESWNYQLEAYDGDVDFVIDLPGRLIRDRDTNMRPIPRNGRLVRVDEAMRSAAPYHCAILHNMSDAFAVKSLACPKLLVFHSSLTGRIAEEGSELTADQVRLLWQEGTNKMGLHCVSVSEFKRKSWGIIHDSIVFSANPVH